MKNVRSALPFFVGLIASTTLMGNGSRLPSQDTDVVARGYAATASIASPSAIYYNPAGLAQISDAEAASGAYIIRPTYSFERTNYQADATERTFVCPSSFVAIPLKKFVVGLGVYAPFGLSTEWPETAFRDTALRSEVKYVTLAVSLATHVTESLTFGLSLLYNHKDVNLHQGAGPGNYLDYRGQDQTPSFNAGLQWHPLLRHAFGLTYTSQAHYNVRGNIAAFGLNVPANVRWVYPDNVVLGYSFKPTPAWDIGFDWDWTNWEHLNTLQLTGPIPVAVPFNWKSSSYFNLGATRHLSVAWYASGGISYSTNSVPDAYFSPAIPDMNKTLLNAGLGCHAREWQLSFVLQISPPASRTIINLPAYLNTNGKYRGSLQAIGGTATYRF